MPFETRPDPDTGAMVTRLTPREVTCHRNYFYQKCFTNDGRRIVFAGEFGPDVGDPAKPNWNYHLLDLESRTALQLTEGARENTFGGFLSPDDKYLYFVRAERLLIRLDLDTLAEEAEDNTPLRVELAGAYLKIGDVQGLPYQANLGDTAGATKSYRKALAIAEQVRAEQPNDPEVLKLVADAHDRVGFVEQRALRWTQAIAMHEGARAIREKLPHSTERDLALAQTWTAIGDCRYIGASVIPKPMILGTAEQAYQTALAILRDIRPAPPELRRAVLQEVGRANQRLGGFYSGGMVSDLPRSLRHHDAALRALGERAALEPADAVARRNYADQFGMKATAQNRSGDWEGALESTAQALAMFKPLAAADPDNVEAQHDLAFAYAERGIAFMSLKRYEEAEAAFKEAIAIRERLIVADPENQEDRRDLRRIRLMLFDVEKARAEQH